MVLQDCTVVLQYDSVSTKCCFIGTVFQWSSEKTKENIVAFWLELGEVRAGYKAKEVRGEGGVDGEESPPPFCSDT